MRIPDDVKSGLRLFVRSPRTAAAAVACIALGTAAVGAAASLLAAALLRPLPFPDGDRLARVWVTGEDGEGRNAVGLADMEDLRALQVFDRVEGAVRERLVFLGETGGRRVEGEGVTEGYFDLLGARPVRGRTFTPEEYGGAGGRVMILTHEAWGRLFDFSDEAVGATIRTPDGPYTVVGLMEPTFTGSIEEDSGEIEFFVPAPRPAEEQAARAVGGAWTVARLATGMTLVRARQEVRSLGDRIAATYPEVRTRTSMRAEPMSENWRGELRRGLWLLLGAAALLLIVAATNVAGLMLTHGLSRRRELALRAALGASLASRMRLLAVEAGTVPAVGGALGLLLGPLLLRGFVAVAPVPVPDYVSLEMDARAAGLTALVLGVATLIAALIPATAARGIRAEEAIRAAGRSQSGGRGERRLGRALIVIQVALATLLVSSTTLLVRSYGKLQDADLGFRTAGMLRVALFVNTEDAPETADVRLLQERARDAVAAQPGVRTVGLVWPTAPLVAAPRTRILHPALPLRDGVPEDEAAFYAADPTFFEAMEIPVVGGRGLTEADHEDGERVVVVSESLAERLGGADAVGTTLEFLGAPRRIVGIVGDAQLTGPRAPSWEQRAVYVPSAQFPNRTVSFAIRAQADDAGALLPGIRRALADVAPASALDWTDTFEAALGEAFQRDRFMVALVGGFSTATLLLAALGILALASYTVSRARVDLGVRQALGGRIVAGILTGTLALVGTGLALGMGLSLAVARLLESLLFGVDSLDPRALAITAAILLAAGLAASVAPARQATRVPPATAMRGD